MLLENMNWLGVLCGDCYSQSRKYGRVFLTQFLCLKNMYPENPEPTQVIVGSIDMGYISDTARNRTHNLFRPKREPIRLGHSDGLCDIYQTDLNPPTGRV